MNITHTSYSEVTQQKIIWQKYVKNPWEFKDKFFCLKTLKVKPFKFKSQENFELNFIFVLKRSETLCDVNIFIKNLTKSTTSTKPIQ